MKSRRRVLIACGTVIVLAGVAGGACLGTSGSPIVITDGGPDANVSDAGPCGGEQEACCTSSPECNSGLSCSNSTCVAASCQPPPTTNACTNPATFPLDCSGTGNCCPISAPFGCPSLNKCYVKQEEAAAACGSACQQCSAPTCVAAPTTTNLCNDPVYNLDCGSGCCNPAYSFVCANNKTCYATKAEAENECGSGCQACSTSACNAAPGTNKCSGKNNPNDCVGDGSTCCPANAPFYCKSSQKCYADQADAQTACGSGTACQACTPGS